MGFDLLLNFWSINLSSVFNEFAGEPNDEVVSDSCGDRAYPFEQDLEQLLLTGNLTSNNRPFGERGVLDVPTGTRSH